MEKCKRNLNKKRKEAEITQAKSATEAAVLKALKNNYESIFKKLQTSSKKSSFSGRTNQRKKKYKKLSLCWIFLAKRAGLPIKKLLLSAVANATQMGIEKENLFIKELRVDKGVVMKRMMPAAMGTGHRINKRTSHVTILFS